MKGDFTRLTFDPRKHYRGVRMQQGRVQLDADWNENLDILLHRIDTETIDVIGECGVPIHHAGFGVVTSFSTLSTEEQDWLTDQGLGSLADGDFYLTQGRAYVDGILVENDHTLPFSQQPFVLPKGSLGFGDGDGLYQLYLDIWERHITALEDPSIREVALGGPDTTTRAQVLWQAAMVKVGEVGENVTCSDVWPGPSTGTLTAQTTPVDTPEDPCPVPPGAGYKRLENQLYRVEIHQGTGGSGPTFKWSRDNGSVVVAVAEFPVGGSSTKLRTTSLGRDDVLGLHENDWVEVLDDERELSGQPGDLVQILEIDPDNVLVLSASLSAFSVLDADGNPTHLKVRRWESAGEIAIPGSGFIALEGGIEVSFDTTGTFRSGDYWLIPARTVPGQYGEIEWPQDSASNPLALLPFGITHHYCALAIVSAETGASGDVTVTLVQDCRKSFPPLTELPTGNDACCSVTVGQDGDYQDLQSALAARPAGADWWTICVLPGIHVLTDTLTVTGAANLTISGCGNQSRLVGPQGKPVLVVMESQEVKIEGLRIEASSPDGAILFGESSRISVVNCTAFNMISTSASGAAGTAGLLIVIDDCEQVDIRDNDLVGLPAVRANGQIIDILYNRITSGGIQIIPPSQVISIEDNLIFNGVGPGIRLGGGDKSAAGLAEMTELKTSAKNPVAGITFVTISRNLLGNMQGSGIVTDLSLAGAAQLSDVELLVISDNQIVSCGLQPDIALGGTVHVGGGIALLGVFTAQIDHNFIAANGGGAPACGIFILDGSDIDIDSNTVVENGVEEGGPEPSSYQAGIAAQFVYGNIFGGFDSQLINTGYPALRIRGNEVVCPAGQALTVVAVGSVVVEGNTLTSREVLKQPAEPIDFGEKAQCVFILDLGLPIWLPPSAPLLQLLAAGQANLHIEDTQLDALAKRFPDGRVMCHDNQVTFTTAVMETIPGLGDVDSGWFARLWAVVKFSALMLSLDDISLGGNQLQAIVPLYALDGIQKYQAGGISLSDLFAYLLKFIHVSTIGITIRANANGLTEPLYANSVSYLSSALAMNVTTSNEATHAYVTFGPKKADANNLSLM